MKAALAKTGMDDPQQNTTRSSAGLEKIQLKGIDYLARRIGNSFDIVYKVAQPGKTGTALMRLNTNEDVACTEVTVREKAAALKALQESFKDKAWM